MPGFRVVLDLHPMKLGPRPYELYCSIVGSTRHDVSRETFPKKMKSLSHEIRSRNVYPLNVSRETSSGKEIDPCKGGNMADLSEEARKKLSASDFAFPKERKEPLVDARHVQEAIARFDQVKDVTNKERDEAWKRIQAAAKKFDVALEEKDWRELFTRNGRKVP